MITEQSIIDLINRNNYDLRLSHNGRWIDQKCTPDVISFVADCIFVYMDRTNKTTFSSRDIQFFDYSNDNVQLLFKKMDTAEDSAKHEYDKFFQQPMKMFANANVLSETVVKGQNIFKLEEREILEYIAMSEKNALKFLRNYIEKVLLDSNMLLNFQAFYDNPTKDSYSLLKKKYEDFIHSQTPIKGTFEPRRIFTKVINPLSYFRNAQGSESGRLSKYKITYDMLMYNRDNFRDIYSGKPKDMTRKDYLLEHPVEINGDYYNYQSEKAKRFLHIFNDTCRNGISEYPEKNHAIDKATHIHHIFPKSQYPEICYYLENLIALTPTQHLNYAHPEGKTREINKAYQHLLLLAKADRIKENLSFNSFSHEYEIIYEFSKFLHVLSIGFDDKEVESISEMDFVSVMNAINVHYANIA